jgi:hypothetical protein
MSEKHLSQLSPEEVEHVAANIGEMLAADKRLQVIMTTMAATARIHQLAHEQLATVVRAGWQVDHPAAVIEYFTAAAARQNAFTLKVTAQALLDVVIPFLGILQCAADDQEHAPQPEAAVEAPQQQGVTSEVLSGSAEATEAGLGTVDAAAETGQVVDGG